MGRKHIMPITSRPEVKKRSQRWVQANEELKEYQTQLALLYPGSKQQVLLRTNCQVFRSLGNPFFSALSSSTLHISSSPLSVHRLTLSVGRSLHFKPSFSNVSAADPVELSYASVMAKLEESDLKIHSTKLPVFSLRRGKNAVRRSGDHISSKKR